MRVLFLGTPDFAVPSLRELVRRRFEVAAAVTPPDRPRGRGMKKTEECAVARAATELGLQVLKPANPNAPAFLDQVRGLKPDILTVAAYRFRLSDELLRTAPLGGLNVHPSLLPRWRGVAPIQRAIQAGDRETGVCIMRVVSRMDAGAVALRETVPIGETETRAELEGRLALVGARLLAEALSLAAEGKLQFNEQDESEVTLAPAFPPEEREVRWERDAAEIGRLVRALEPSPGAYFMLGGMRVGVKSARPLSRDPGGPPGTLVKREGESWRVACGRGQLEIGCVQPAGGDAMTMQAFVNGRRLRAGALLVPKEKK